MAEGRSRLPGDLPLFSSGLGAAEWDFAAGDEFWQQVNRLTGSGDLATQMDLAMVGKSAPRVWLILHEPGQPELSTLVALAFARELGGRDLAALVLDCDDQSQSLTRWTERVESEGWIDLARYGTSVLTSGIPLPFEGRRGYLLGVGSFAPTDVTPAEIEQVVKRLRRQADDLILVAPADQIGELWAPAASIRLLCWDRAVRPEAELEGLVAGFATAGHPLTGLVGFGLPMATSAVAPPADPELEVDAAPPADDFETPADDGSAEQPEAPAAEPSEVPPAAPVKAAAPEEHETAPADGWTDAPDLPVDAEERKGTSGVFWFLAIAAVVVVGIMSVYWFQYGREVESPGTRQTELATAQPAPHTGPVDRAPGELANQDGSSSGAVALPAGNRNPVVADSTASAVVDTSTVAADSSVSQVAAVEEPEATETSVAAAGSPAVRDSIPAEPRFSLDPYRGRVGAAGWALHLYSFPDTTRAKVEVAELHRRGFETELRAVQTLKKGRWWRVYVGSFATKAEARAAAPLLKKKLRTDWANPTRF